MADVTISGLNPAVSVNITDVLPISNGINTLKATISQIRGSSGAITGSIIMWPLNTAPEGYLVCNGLAVSRSTYSALFAVLGTTYGAGDGSTTFNVPDYRGQFLRGWANGSSTDPDRASRTNRGDGTTGDNVGTKQADDFKSHNHSMLYGTGDYPNPYYAARGAPPFGLVTGNQGLMGTAGGSETRPTNVYINYCIKT